MSDVTDEVFADILGGLDQIAAHTRGEESGILLHVPKTMDVGAIRKRTGNSQAKFARSIGVNTSTLKQWEQGRRNPQGPARVLLAMIERDPGVVTRILSAPPDVERVDVQKDRANAG